jgi:hypothetical protein
MAKPIQKGYDSNVEDMPDDDDPASTKYAEDGTQVTRNEGGIEVVLNEEDTTDEQEDDPEFDADLTSKMSDNERCALGGTLREYIDIDLQSRAKWEQRMLQGLEIIGLEDVPEDRTAFHGASAVTHPAIVTAIVQFQARAMEEILPPDGPVKVGTEGDASQEDTDRAERVEEYMNYQLTEEDDEYYSDTDSMLFYLPYAGSAFKKVAIDPIIGRTRSRFIPADDFIVPYFARSLKTATRYTHRYTMSMNNFKRAVDKGEFTDYNFPQGMVTQLADENKRLQDTSDDRSEAYHTDDQILTLMETHIEWEFKWEKEGTEKKFKKPYAITWEWETGVVVSVKRIWAEDDEDCDKQVWFTHYKYLPGFGFYGLGLLHIIGSLGKAASGALRALLDGAQTSSLQGGFKSKDARISGEVTFSPGTWIDVDMTAEEMAKAFYTPDFKPPTPALFSTLEILVSGIEKFSSTTEAMVGEASNTGPVGTTLALIEQGSKVFSGIHKRLHNAARREFRMIGYCNWRYMHVDEYPFKVAGKPKKIFRSDFAPDVDIKPVSDPNIFSNVQRIALAQAMLALIKDQPDLFDKPKRIRAVRSMLKAMRIPDWQSYFPEDDLQRLDPVSENQTIMMGGAATAFPEQDHQAHMQIHGNFLQEVMATNDPDTIQRIVPVIKAHVCAHFAMMYRQRIEQEMVQKGGVPLPPFDPNDPESTKPLPQDIENQVARAVAALCAPPAPAKAPQPDPKIAAANATVQAIQMKSKAGIQAKGQETAAEIKRKDALAAAEIRRKGHAHGKEQGRKDAELIAQLTRDGVIPDSGQPPNQSQGALPAPGGLQQGQESGTVPPTQ